MHQGGPRVLLVVRREQPEDPGLVGNEQGDGLREPLLEGGLGVLRAGPLEQVLELVAHRLARDDGRGHLRRSQGRPVAACSGRGPVAAGAESRPRRTNLSASAMSSNLGGVVPARRGTPGRGTFDHRVPVVLVRSCGRPRYPDTHGSRSPRLAP